MVAVARDYASLDLDLATGEDSSRMAAVEGLLRQLTGAEAALVVNNHAAATLLTLAGLAAGREVVVSRGELPESSDRFRLSEAATAAGAVLREVGTTNITRLEDFRQALGDRTAALMSVHVSSFQVVGLSAAVSVAELASLARERQLPLVYDLANGAMVDFAEFGLLAEPTLAGSVRQGADVVLASGDRLFGGPPCGIVLGRQWLVEQVARHPLAQALRVDKLTLAALAATLRLYQEPAAARQEIPLLQLLSTSPVNLKNRAERLAPQIAACPAVAGAEPVAASTYLEGVSIPARELPTWCIALRPSQGSAERLASALRTGRPAVIGRTEGDRLLLDLRAVFPRQDQDLVAAVCALSGPQGSSPHASTAPEQSAGVASNSEQTPAL
jgi:L-seryl-tRNA(Ser) seleniumtransferase